MIAPEIPHSKPDVTEADRTAVCRAIESSMIAEGALTRRFEDAVGQWLGIAAGTAWSSGTAALAAALRAVGVGAGDEVVIPTYTCDAVERAVAACGASAVLCDVEDDRVLSARTVTPHVGPRTRAVVAVHIYGVVADVPSLQAFGVPVIEDCCQSFGARHDGRFAGVTGAAVVLSFHATKLLTTAEGGMALSADPAVAERLRRDKDGAGTALGWMREPLSDMQAALGLSQLARYHQMLERRAALAERYRSALADLPIALPRDRPGSDVCFRFAVRTPRPFDEVQRAFLACGVHVRRGVDCLLHRRRGLGAGQFPNAERLFAETVSLPLYPALTDAEADRILDAARRVFVV